MNITHEVLKGLGNSQISNEILRQMELRDLVEKYISPYEELLRQVEVFRKDYFSLNCAEKALRDFPMREVDRFAMQNVVFDSMRNSALSRKYEHAQTATEKIRESYQNIERSLGIYESIERANKSLHRELFAAPKALDYALVKSEYLAKSLSEIQKPFEQMRQGWQLPKELTSAVSALEDLQKQLGPIHLPTFDWASAATLNDLLGTDGIRSQLAALGIAEDGTLSGEDSSSGSDNGIGLSRRALELIALINFIWTILVPIYQEISSREWQAEVNKRFDEQRAINQEQLKILESLSILVARAIEKEAEISEARYVVLDRVVTVKSKPSKGKVEAQLLPKEVVTLLSEKEKWIEVRYYHWINKEYRSGWVLKKYLKRVPLNHSK